MKLHEQTVTNQLLPVSRWPAVFSHLSVCQLCRWLNLKVLLSTFFALDFLDSGLHKNWLEKDSLLNKESDIPTATIRIHREPFWVFQWDGRFFKNHIQVASSSKLHAQLAEFIPIVKNILFSFRDDGSIFGPIPARKTIVTHPATDRLHRSIKWWHIYNFQNVNSLLASAWWQTSVRDMPLSL